MSLNISFSKDLPGMYSALADTKVAYNSVEIDIFFQDDYEVNGVSDKLIKVQTKDVISLQTGEIIIIDSISYKVLNFNATKTKLETIIALSEIPA